MRALRALEGGHARTPVVILSADVAEEARQEALANGADVFLPKPIQAARLLDAIAKLCQAGEAAAGGAGWRAARQQPSRSTGRSTTRRSGSWKGLGSRSDFMDKLVRVFIDDNAVLIEKMQEAVDAKHYGEFRSLLHALKGSAGSIGADDLARTCSRVHQLTEVELRARGGQHVQAIRADFEIARGELTSYLQKRKSGAV
ncbi:MAG: response regulator [Burkholderiales bacterium]|nr:response regulator [Burkholderiales bacterium]